MKFSKWHGIGNDFVLIDETDLETALTQNHPEVAKHSDGRARLSDQAARALCHRQFGVGADGVLVIGGSDQADARMLIHNSDGSMAEMCGNGIRVAAQWYLEHKTADLTRPKALTFETAAGIIRPTVLEDGNVRVDMGELEDQGELEVVTTEQVVGDRISVGNPHYVIERNPAGEALHKLGPVIEQHELFPNRTNVEFWSVVDSSEPHVRMRVWERGCGETLGCGTGACAVAFSARKHKQLGDRIRVSLPGGDLLIEFEGNRAYMTGPAHKAWHGEVDLTNLINGMPTGV